MENTEKSPILRGTVSKIYSENWYGYGIILDDYREYFFTPYDCFDGTAWFHNIKLGDFVVFVIKPQKESSYKRKNEDVERKIRRVSVMNVTVVTEATWGSESIMEEAEDSVHGIMEWGQ